MHAALQRALRWEIVDPNVATAVEPPTVPHREVESPAPADVQRLLRAAADHDPLLGTLLFVAATTGPGGASVRHPLVRPRRRGRHAIARAAKEHGELAVGPTRRTRSGSSPSTRPPSSPSTGGGPRRTRPGRRPPSWPPTTRTIFSRSPRGDTRPAPSAITHAFVRLRRTLGLEQIQLKSLRHFAATQMLAAGVDLRATAGRLGHSGGGATTLKVYAHTLPEADQRAAAVLGALAAPVVAPGPAGPQ